MKRTHVIANTAAPKRRICRELIDLTEVRGAGGDERLITVAPTSTNEPSKSA